MLVTLLWGVLSLAWTGCMGSAAIECPTALFTGCAQGGGANQCVIPKSVNNGFLSYGSDGSFLLIPFTNTGTSDLKIGCQDYLGDPSVTETKFCCYIKSDGPFIDPGNFQTVDSRAAQDRDGPFILKYGPAGRYLYHSYLTRAYIGCDDTNLGDPGPGVAKDCLSKKGVPSSLSNAQWYSCSGDCKTNPYSVHWVRSKAMGIDRAFYSLAMAQDSALPCQERLLTDPSPGATKACDISEPLVQFEDMIGEWYVMLSCTGGGCEEMVETTVGFEVKHEKSVTDEWTKSWQKSFSLGFTFKKASGDMSIGSSTSHTVSQSLTTSMKVSVTQKTKITCQDDALWQWRVTGTQNDLYSRSEMTLLADSYHCGSARTDLAPQCVPGFCVDDKCQECLDMSGSAVKQDL